MHEYELHFINGHFFIELDNKKWLLDTGAPTSFSNEPSITFANKTFEIDSDYMGLTAEMLSGYIDMECHGLLAVDVLNDFDMIFDQKNALLTVSEESLEMDGDKLPLSDFMDIPIVTVHIGEKSYNMFFDTGAKLSYLQDESLSSFPKLETVTDFYPGFGEFETDTYAVDFIIGSEQYALQCGSLPDILGMTLVMAGTQGILGNEVFRDKVVGYFPRRGELCLGN